MRLMTPRPFLLVLTLLLVVGAIVAIELRFGVAGPVNTQAADPTPAAQENEGTPTANQADASEGRRGREDGSSPAPGGRTTPEKVQPGGSEERIERKEAEFPRAEEIVAPTGFINTKRVSINEARGEKVVLVDFWTYACFNCQNTQPYLNAWHEEYADDGLFIIGVHTPEFGFEREPVNVERAVREAGIEYPVVLDNNYATWNAYDQRYWPAMYLIDADGFIRYKHFGEGAYEETEAKIRELLAEKDRISG
jgi:thiol-disulfide isomerase/thioredoxin